MCDPIGDFWRNPTKFQTLGLDDLPERQARIRVAVHQQITFAIGKSILAISEISRDLFHPRFVGIGRAAGEVYGASLKFHDE